MSIVAFDNNINMKEISNSDIYNNENINKENINKLRSSKASISMVSGFSQSSHMFNHAVSIVSVSTADTNCTLPNEIPRTSVVSTNDDTTGNNNRKFSATTTASSNLFAQALFNLYPAKENSCSTIQYTTDSSVSHLFRKSSKDEGEASKKGNLKTRSDSINKLFPINTMASPPRRVSFEVNDDFLVVINDKVAIPYLTEFLKTRYIANHLYFWTEIQLFKGFFDGKKTRLFNPEGETNSETVREKAKYIFNYYVKENGKDPVNLTDEIRKLITNRLENDLGIANISVNLFYEVLI